eukprot:5903919-Pleurochrysis_carterae.AAC.4
MRSESVSGAVAKRQKYLAMHVTRTCVVRTYPDGRHNRLVRDGRHRHGPVRDALALALDEIELVGHRPPYV